LPTFIELDVYDEKDGASQVVYVNTSQIEAYGASGTLPADVYDDIPRVQETSFVVLKSGQFWILSNTIDELNNKLDSKATTRQARI